MLYCVELVQADLGELRGRRDGRENCNEHHDDDG
jgi:hypothetical protein